MSNLFNKRSHKLILVVIDLILILAAYLFAFIIRYNTFDQRNWESFVALIPWILLISVSFIAVYELYTLNRKSVWDILKSIFISVTFMSLLIMAASFLFREFAFPRSVIAIAYFIKIVFLCLWNFIFIKINQGNTEGVFLFVGDEEDAQKYISQIKHPLFKGSKVKHVYLNTDLERIYQIIQQVDHVLVSPEISKEKKAHIIYYAIKNGKTAYVVPSLYDLLLSHSVITSLDDTMVMAVKPFGLSLDQQFIKRIFDIIFSIFILILMLPLFLFVAVLIKIDDPKGKIIFKQARMGKENKEFCIYKFRSMIEDAEEQTGPILAKHDDQRITKIGHFLRKYRIDELPQFYNVLIGNMSIVGPRPERDFFIKQYVKMHESYQYRSTVKPGITGYAQIMGKYTTDVEDKLRFDLYYIRNYSFWLDIVIILRTLIVLLDKKKSEGSMTENSEKKSIKEPFQM